MALLRRAVLPALLASAAVVSPVRGHGGLEDPVRPVLAGVEPVRPGIRAEVLYSGAWQVRLTNRSPEELSVLDPSGAPFLRLGPAGTLADFSSRAWYQSNSPEGVGRPPLDFAPGAPDFRLVATEPSWTWFDVRLREEPGSVSRRMAQSGERSRIGTWSIPLRLGDRQGRIHGRLELEPVTGIYRHALDSPPNPAPGVTVGLVAAGVVPAVTIENTTSESLTLIGKADEPFARVGTDVEVNLRSPTWHEIAQSNGLTPTIPSDPAAEPLWNPALNGTRWSWPEFRGRPPGSEPSGEALAKGDPIVVRRWSVPVLIGAGRIVAIEGRTEFVPLPPERHGPSWATLAGGALAGGGLALLALRLAKKKGRRPSGDGGAPAGVKVRPRS